MNDRPLANVCACAFDAYGTLFDFNTVERCREQVGDKADALRTLWRTTQLQYFWLRSLMGKHKDFEAVTGDALDFAMATLGIDDKFLRNRLMQLYLEFEPYPDVISTLGQLKEMGIRTAIHSNGTPDVLDSAVKSCGFESLFDDVISIETVGIFKPHPKAYQLAVDRLGLPAEGICFLSSNSWDVHGAATFGFRVVWVNRFGLQPDILPGEPDHVIKTLTDLPALLGVLKDC